MAKKTAWSRGWKNAIDRASTEVLAKINLTCYEIAWELFTSVVKLTPSPSNPGQYAKGLLANQWYPAENSASSARSSSIDSNGSGSLDRINAFAKGGVEFYCKDGKVVLANNMPYAYRAEVLGWPKEDNPIWSGKVGPYRMVSRSLIAISAKYKNVRI